MSGVSLQSVVSAVVRNCDEDTATNILTALIERQRDRLEDQLISVTLKLGQITMTPDGGEPALIDMKDIARAALKDLKPRTL